MRHFLIIILIFFISCSTPLNDKHKIDVDNVDYVEIRKQFDTVSLRLTNNQVADLIETWNNSSPKGPYKYLPEYSLTIHFRGDSSLLYRTSSDLIKQRSDWAYSVGDKKYFKNI